MAGSNQPGGKAIFLLMDGTKNSVASGRAEDITNVYLTNICLGWAGEHGPQMTYYHPGVGTRGEWIAPVTGRGLDHIIREAYVNIAANYSGHEPIYIIGFSRGAAAARGVAAMISQVGLLRADKLNCLESAWRLFVGDYRSGKQQSRLKAQVDAANGVYPGAPPVINFLGLFDAVSGTYWDVLRRFVRARVDEAVLEASVRVGVHIVALDDNRNPSFKPLLWQRRNDASQKLEQIWMPGVHADIGGNTNHKFLSTVAFLTMMDRWMSHCPEVEFFQFRFDDAIRDLFAPEQAIHISDERQGIARKFLLRSARKLGEEHDGMYLHPIYDTLFNRHLQFKNKGLRRYITPIPFERMRRIRTRWDHDFRTAARQVLARMEAKA